MNKTSEDNGQRIFSASLDALVTSLGFLFLCVSLFLGCRVGMHRCIQKTEMGSGDGDGYRYSRMIIEMLVIGGSPE